ncbi:hypothetical protein Ahy_B01g057027 [Arachis hypogaea]|uniref:SWIM-type domain-containing protein n=1 Tax=Arachis hypogaea TaxID=3818 RepID=A0A445B041_ARAHY|nr:hypothetical protein Ahy_B01g057027 [Arachis hypogaea]
MFDCVSGVIEDTTNLAVYRNGEIIRNTHEGLRFVCQNPFSFMVPCTMTFMELQNSLCQSMENGMLRRVSSILYQNPVIVFGGLIQFDIMPIIDETSMRNIFQSHRQTQVRQPQIELYVEFKNVEADGIQNDLDTDDDRVAVYEGINSDSKEDFEATYDAGGKDEDNDVGVEAAVENVVVLPVVSQPMDVLPFMRNLDLDVMHVLDFPEYANIGVADLENGEFRIGMKYSARKSVVVAIRSYTICRGVNYNVYEFEPQTFYVKCKTYGCGCDWFIRRIKAKMQHAGNIVVHQFDRRNEVFEVREMSNEKVLAVDLARRTCDCGHFQVELLPCRHAIACCANQRLD